MVKNLNSLVGICDIWYVQTVLLIPVRCVSAENHCRVSLHPICALRCHIHFGIGVLHCTFIVGT